VPRSIERSAIKSIRDLKNCIYITVHASGGLEMMKAIKKEAKKINNKIKVLGVTVLTSLNNKTLKQIGHTKNVSQLVLKQASLIKKSGCDGIVCSAKEAKIIKKKYKKLFILTPGIRLPGDKKHDQSRVVTPFDALVKNKVDAIVMGRSLIKNNIKKNIQRLINHIH
jgi:orotidine-5'-phosphate decarboxylase